MRQTLFLAACLLAGVPALAQGPVAAPSPAAAVDPLEAGQRETATRLIEAARASKRGWDRLLFLTDTFGARFSGTPALERALAWAAEEMKHDGFDQVRLEPVKVPRWVRGRESLELLSPEPAPLVVLGLGGSVGTPAEGVEAEVMAVSSEADLEARATEARGRIVLFNVPYTNYGETVRYRGAGPSMAAKRGAVGMLLRSVGLPGMRTPHTGALSYDEQQPKIPAAALPTEDADRLQRMIDRGQKPRVRLKMDAHLEPDADSANLVAEIRGREKPEEIVLLGGHFDSWDVGSGAMDDAGGCVASWEALRLIRELGLRPRRTLRVVLFTNEENGLRGGLAYRDAHSSEPHLLALESDSGVFRPQGFGFSGQDSAREKVTWIASLLEPIGAGKIFPSGGGADIRPVVEATGAAAMSLNVDGSKYFLYHHTPADTPDKLSAEDFGLSTAGLATMTFLVADWPVALGE